MTQRKDHRAYEDVLRQQGITKLFHFTDRENLEAIIRNGGLYSWADCEERHITIAKPGGDMDSRGLDARAGLEHHVRLSFTRQHPMMYVALREERISNPVILEIDPQVVGWEGTKFADRNATKTGARIGGSLDDLKAIHFNSVKARKHFDLPEEEQMFYQAEVMVHHFIPLQYITNISQFGIAVPSQPQTMQARLPYTAQISRAHPTAMVFIVDNSASMGCNMVTLDGETITAAQAIQRITNRQIAEIVGRCVKGDETRHYFDIAVLGYGGEVYSAWKGTLAGKDFVSPEEVAHNPYQRIITTKQVKTRRGVMTKEVEEHVWVDDRHDGGYTRMDLALRRAKDLLEPWIAAHPESYPPTVFHITDGIPVGTTEEAVMREAEELKSMYTNDGNVLLFNVHLSSTEEEALVLPASKAEVEDNEYSKFLYEMSSLLPMRYNETIAQRMGMGVSNTRHVAMSVNATADQLVQMMDIGTPTNISNQ